MNPKVKNTLLGLRIYNIALAIIYLCGFIVLPLSFASDPEIEEEGIIFAVIFSLICMTPFIILFLVGFFMVPKRSKVNWIFQVVLVGIGFMAPLTILPAILLLIFLISDEVRDYYYRDALKTTV